MAQRVGRGIALLFHNRGTRRGWVVSSTPRPHFTPGKDPVPILQEAGWAPGPGWTGEKSLPHRDSIPDRPARSQSLYRLSYPAHIQVIYNLFLCPSVRKSNLTFTTKTSVTKYNSVRPNQPVQYTSSPVASTMNFTETLLQTLKESNESKIRTEWCIEKKIIIINIKDRALWSVPFPKLQLLSPTFLRSSNCSPSLWSVVVWFQRGSVLWHSLQVLKPVPSVFIYLV